jgi:hypothetical protein
MDMVMMVDMEAAGALVVIPAAILPMTVGTRIRVSSAQTAERIEIRQRLVQSCHQRAICFTAFEMCHGLSAFVI